jgi:hypothetical protein
MKPILLKSFAVTGCCLCLIVCSRAQLMSSITVNGEQISHSRTKEQEPIYSGAEYLRFPNKIENGIAYYRADTITLGDLVYHGRSYKNVPLIYDQVSDELVTIGLSGRVLIRLFSPKIDSFRVHGARFIYLVDATNAEKQGFWEIIVDSKTKLLKRELKIIETRVIDSRLARVIIPHLYYRIFHNNEFHEVRDKKQVPEIFADRKQQMESFLKSNRRRLRKAGLEGMLKAATIYYNEINSGP